MIIEMAIVGAITFILTMIWYRYIYPLRLARRLLKWAVKAVLRIAKRIPRYRLLDKGCKFQIGTFELELHPRDNRPKLNIQRYGKRD